MYLYRHTYKRNNIYSSKINLPQVVPAISGESAPSVHVDVASPTKVNPELQVNVTAEPDGIVPMSGERAPPAGAATLVQSAD